MHDVVKNSRVLFLLLFFFLLGRTVLPALDYPESVPGDLYLEYIDKDLDTASLGELVLWAKSLGLSDQGDRTALAKAIKDWYQARQATLKPQNSPLPSPSPLPVETPGAKTEVVVPSPVPTAFPQSAGPLGEGSLPNPFPAASGSPVPPGGQLSGLAPPGPGENKPGESAAPQSGTTGSASDLEITIESATSAHYFTIEAVDAKLFRLLGGVKLMVKEQKGSNIHYISAQEILFDQDSEEMTARGSVEYTLEQGGEKQTFWGDEMRFIPSTGDAVFINGRGKKKQTISDSSTLEFHIQAGMITRTLRDIMLFYHTSLSSSVWTPDAYQIGASKIGVLSPGEWAINDLVLYLGRVPVLYVPFFYLPPDELIFHPAIGERTYEGSFVQTTWYLVGKKAKTDQSLSFLQLDTGVGDNYSLEPHGLFLKKVPGAKDQTSGAAQGTDASKSRDAITVSLATLLLDYYSRLGYLGGFNLDFAGNFITKANLKLKLAATKRIYAASNGYTDIYTDDDVEAQQIWDSTHLFGSDIPFRYAFDFSGQFKVGNWTSAVTLSFPSDPYILALYDNRSEDIDWSGLLGIGSESTSSTSTLTTAKVVTPITVTNSFVLSIPEIDPYIKSIKLSKFSFYWPWGTAAWTNPDSDERSRYLSSAKIAAEKYFFYPTLLTLSDTALTVDGTLFQYPPATKAASKKTGPDDKAAVSSEKPDETLVFVFPGEGDAKAVSPAGAADVQAPAVPGPATEPALADQAESSDDPGEFTFDGQPLDLGLSTVTGEPFSFSLSYTATPSGSVQAKFSSVVPADPFSLSVDPWYWLGTYNMVGSLTYTSDLFYGLVNASGGISMTQKGRNIFGETNLDSTESNYATYVKDLDSAQLTAAQLIYTKVTQNNTVKLYPLKYVPLLSGSSIVYTLSEDLYEYKYNTASTNYDEVYFDWNDSEVTAHSSTVNLSAKVDWFSAAAALTYALPPLDQALSYSASTGLGFLNLSWSGSSSMDDATDVWTNNDMTFGLTARMQSLIKLPADLSLVSTVVYSPEANTLESWKNTFNYGTFAAWATMTDAQQKNYSAGVWSTGEKAFQVSEIGSSLSLKYSPADLWLGRIRQDLSFNYSYKQNLLLVTDSSLSYSLAYILKMNEFLDFNFTISGANTKTYKYFDVLANRVGLNSADFFETLWDSLNIFDESALRKGFFKLKALSMTAVHDLGDWKLSFTMAAAPLLDSTSRQYNWDSSFTLLLQWNSIKELKDKFAYSSDDNSFVQSSD